ncbi:MAG: 23S rRNA (uracil(1939)-C(5))-methyltransferase RlmD [Flavobacteriales bacterium]|nr:23S rRNA (uracil(1939)-C(5))-methyltransferase RlmD [Flavobacteriales bacterium]
MARTSRLFRKGELIEVDIRDIAFGGKGIGKIPTDQGDFTVFVLNTIPGQRVRARVVKCKNKYAECKLDEVLHPSQEEVSIPYQRIPGAPYASLPIEVQHNMKERTTLELYRRIGGVEDVDSVYKGLLPSPENWHYRNKMEYAFSVIRYDLDEEEMHDDFGLGFKHRGTWWAVENLDRDSGLFDPHVENHLKDIRQWCENTGLPSWHPPKREGFFRYLVARKSYYSGELLFNLVTTSSDLDRFDLGAFIDMMKSLFGECLAGIIHTINDDKGDRVEPRDGDATLVYGKDKIVEMINGLKFEISMYSFFQTNPKSAERLYDAAIACIGDKIGSDDVVLDLFCGTGTISQLISRTYDCRVVGVDIIASAINDARANAQRNGIDDISFYAEDAGKFLYNHPEYRGKIKALVLDPPRAGIAPKTLRKVMALESNRIVYISCNPATQARDTEVLREGGYRLTHLQLCDQFPHTSHIEAIAVYDRIHGNSGAV